MISVSCIYKFFGNCNEDTVDVFIAQFNWKNVVFLNFVLTIQEQQTGPILEK